MDLSVLRYVYFKNKEKPCKKCNKRFPTVCMQYHHRDPSTKMFNISTFLQMNKNNKPIILDLEDVAKEIEKCDIICFNCHLIHHNSGSYYSYNGYCIRIGNFPNWKVDEDDIKNAVCIKCGENNINCLYEVELYDIKQLGREIETIQQPISILCGNCYILEDEKIKRKHKQITKKIDKINNNESILNFLEQSPKKSKKKRKLNDGCNPIYQ